METRTQNQEFPYDLQQVRYYSTRSHHQQTQTFLKRTILVFIIFYPADSSHKVEDLRQICLRNMSKHMMQRGRTSRLGFMPTLKALSSSTALLGGRHVQRHHGLHRFLLCGSICVFSNSFSIEHAWQPATRCQLWACYGHTVITVESPYMRGKLSYALALFQLICMRFWDCHSA